jgi:DNA modification methylase
MSAAPPIPRRVDLGAVTVLVGHVLDVLDAVPDASVQSIVTSPPYWGLRDYGCAPIDWPAVEYRPIWYLPPVRVEAMRCALGLEPDVSSFIAHMVLVFRGLRRVLRDDGTCWVNLGSSYATGTNAPRGASVERDGQDKPAGWTNRCQDTRRSPEGLAAKQLVHQPSLLALALQADGWIWRSDIVWEKPNPMPESCNDRPTVAHEPVLLFAKRPRYFYDATAIREPDSGRAAGNGFVGRQGGARDAVRSGGVGSAAAWQPGGGRNARSVWKIATAPFKGAHFATFPPELARRCILAGTSERGACAACGAPWRREVEREFVPQADVSPERAVRGADGQKPLDETNRRQGYPRGTTTTTTTGWKPSCGCVGAAVVPCAVLDPFGGSGTTGAVAKTHGRVAVLCEAQPEYLPLIARRVAEAPGYQPTLGGLR